MVQYLSSSEQALPVEKLYLAVRQLEGRILSDEVVKSLPEYSQSSGIGQEWLWRGRSLNRLKTYLNKQQTIRLEILDLGCGNGWMSNRLAENPNWKVWGMDVNRQELEQADRVFQRDNLVFYFGKVLDGVLPEAQFDVIVLAASVQYFSNFEELILALKKSLRPGGEIHIIDSPFYANSQQQANARLRTNDYYQKMGVPEMAAFYHHHLRSDAIRLGGRDKNASLFVRFLQKIRYLPPFPWMVFEKNA